MVRGTLSDQEPGVVGGHGRPAPCLLRLSRPHSRHAQPCCEVLSMSNALKASQFPGPGEYTRIPHLSSTLDRIAYNWLRVLLIGVTSCKVRRKCTPMRFVQLWSAQAKHAGLRRI